VLSPLLSKSATIAALTGATNQPLKTGFTPTGRIVRPVPASNRKNGRFTLWKKPMFVKAVFPVAAGGGGCICRVSEAA
jgi:hypothetical protein